ncbi:hypothetical protein LTR27_009933 [Elasticomyces elasticus]|nr:hypothetical protein LTR27_009933 [Elasticomyces elasticus]
MSVTTDQYGNRYFTSQRHRKDDSSDCDDKPLKKKAQPKKHDRETGAERSEDDQPLKKKDNRSNHIAATAIKSSSRENLQLNSQPEVVEVNMSSESIEEEEEYDKHAAISKEELARYVQCYADASEWLAGLEKHEQALVDQADGLAQHVGSLMHRLNEQRRVPCLSLEEFGQPNFDELMEAAEALPADTHERRMMLRRVRGAILVQIATLPHKFRRGLADICESMQGPLKDIRNIMITCESLEDEGFESTQAARDCCDTIRSLKHKVAELYRRVLQDWAKLVIEFIAAIRELEQDYVVDLEIEEGQQRRHTRAGYPLGATLAGSIEWDCYEDVKTAFEACFASAAMVSPATFAYDSWRDEI